MSLTWRLRVGSWYGMLPVVVHSPLPRTIDAVVCFLERIRRVSERELAHVSMRRDTMTP